MEHRTARAGLTEVVGELATAYECILHTAAGLGPVSTRPPLTFAVQTVCSRVTALQSSPRLPYTPCVHTPPRCNHRCARLADVMHGRPLTASIPPLCCAAQPRLTEVMSDKFDSDGWVGLASRSINTPGGGGGFDFVWLLRVRCVSAVAAKAGTASFGSKR